ncbi:hypothetical protein Scep_001743 [Stephania cephalantha]|uniref:Uncharacterized protein n=1 Tax=Stephania cephalantha TaxID=152367 RepID=A0AAP0Q3N2_9MAGN
MRNENGFIKQNPFTFGFIPSTSLSILTPSSLSSTFNPNSLDPPSSHISL